MNKTDAQAKSHFGARIQRGGRLTKWKGKPASISPTLMQLVGSISPTALNLAASTAIGAALLGGSGGAVQAQQICAETSPGSSSWDCGGVSSSTQYKISANEFLTVNLGPNLNIDTAHIDGTTTLTVETNNGIDFNVAGGAILASGRGGISIENHDGPLSFTMEEGSTFIESPDGARSLNVLLNNNGSGDLNIDLNGTIIGNSSGLVARNKDAGSIIANIGKTADIDALGTGIGLTNFGAGGKIIATVDGSVIGDEYGINAQNLGDDTTGIEITTGSDSYIQATDTSNRGYGISATTVGYGDTIIKANGIVDGEHTGIYAQHTGSRSGDIIIETGSNSDIIGRSGYGVYATNASSAGSGNTVITAGGDITGEGAGIYARASQGEGDTSLTIVTNIGTTVSNTSAGDGTWLFYGGIYADVRNKQALNITINGDVIAQSGNGIHAKNSGEKSSNVEINGNVTAQTGSGFYLGQAAGRSANVEVGDSGSVNGEVDGIQIQGLYNLFEESSGDLIVDISGTVAGGSGAAINNGAGRGTFTVSSTGTLQSESGIAYDSTSDEDAVLEYYQGFIDQIHEDLENYLAENPDLSELSEEQLAYIEYIETLNVANLRSSTLNVSGTLNGSALMGRGSDALNVFAGASFAPDIILDGGDGTSIEDGEIDRLTFNGFTGDFTGDQLVNWEDIVFNDTDVSLTDLDGTLTSSIEAGHGIFLNDGSTLKTTGAYTLKSSLNLAQGTEFKTVSTGTDTATRVDGYLVNSGTINMQNGTTGDTLTVGESYSGDGTLLVDVDFASDTSDRLVIEGNASGVTRLNVSDITTGMATGNDVAVVTAIGSAEDFVLASGPLTAGAFDYDLEYDPGTFVLRAGVNGTGAVYEALPAILGNFNRMSTLEQRVGQRQWSAGNVATGAQPSGSWLRLQGNSTNLEADTGTTSSINSWGLQAGIDFNVEEGDAGHWVLGVTGQYGSSNASVANALGFGDIGSEGYGLGLTATWYGNSGTYFDAQGQVNWINSDISSSTGGSLATDQDSTAYALSAEVGHRFKVSETGTWVPQAQLVWGQVDSDSFTDNVGNAVDLGSNDSLVGRLGLAYEYDSLTTGGNSQKMYAVANILHDFEASNSVDVAGATLTSDAGQTWGEIGVGGSLAWDESKTLYGEVSYAQSFDSSNNDTLAATAGLRIQW